MSTHEVKIMSVGKVCPHPNADKLEGCFMGYFTRLDMEAPQYELPFIAIIQRLTV